MRRAGISSLVALATVAATLVAGTNAAAPLTAAAASAAPRVPAAPAVPVRQQEPDGSGAWTQVPTTTIAGESPRFMAVSVPARRDVWAVGYTFDDVGGALEDFTLAEHLVGSSFQIVSTPDPTGTSGQTADFLYAVAGTAASDLWAVGTWTDAADQDQALIEHWDGHAWSVTPAADPGADNDVLEGVTTVSTSDAWAVGAFTRTGQFYERPLAEHWNGKRWTAVPVPNPAGCTGHSFLSAVTSVSAQDLFAVGWCESAGNGPDQAYIESWNGTAWAVVDGKGSIPRGSQLNGVSAVSGSSVWAVGDSQRPGNYPSVPLTIHFDGTAWSITKVAKERASELNGVATTAASTWAVGAGPSPQPPFAGPLALSLVGGAWRPATVPVSFANLFGVAIDGATGTAWAVGLAPAADGNDVPLAFAYR